MCSSSKNRNFCHILDSRNICCYTRDIDLLVMQVFLWADKYRPRKPRFFNRVHTGFEWNKYNQTHYDFDNPPPKIVQGYKFNIFYPDLIKREDPPTYSITPDEKSSEFAVSIHSVLHINVFTTTLIAWSKFDPYSGTLLRPWTMRFTMIISA